MPKPYYQDEAVVIYQADCREILPQLEPVDLVLTDPPYGMNWNTDSSRFSGGEPSSQYKRGTGRTDWSRVVGDGQPFNPAPWLDFSKKVIFWGANHYAQRLPVGTTLVWLKRFDGAFGSFLSDAEIGWMKGGYGVYCFRDMSFTRHTLDRCHPTQKPTSLFQWCIEKSGGAETILDPFMGSGTTLRAAKDLGRKAIGIEIEEKYCEIAAKRMAQEVLPL